MPVNPPPLYPKPPLCVFRLRPLECASCGATLRRDEAECSYCRRPNPDARPDMGAFIEVTSLDDPAPRYVPGWPPPKPLPPADRLLTESGRAVGGAGALTVGYGLTIADTERVRHFWRDAHVGPVPRKPRRRLVDAVLQALGLR